MDEIIKYCTARIVRDTELGGVIGSGVLLRQDDVLDDRIYLITAAHCLKDEANELLPSIRVEVFNPLTNIYEQIRIDDVKRYSVLSNDNTKDVAIVILKSDAVLTISPDLPTIPIVTERSNCTHFKCAGFPVASGNEYTTSTLAWNREDAEEHKLYLHLSDYIEDYAEGFSGGGIFCETHQEILLLGIVSKFQGEERGCLLQGEGLSYLNEELYRAHRKQVRLSYVVSENITEKAICEHLARAYKNLGERYIPDFNIETEVQKKVEAVCRTPRYYNRLEARLDRWLERYKPDWEKGSNEKKIDNFRQEAIRLFYEISENRGDFIDFSNLQNQAKILIGEFGNMERQTREIERRQNIFRAQKFCYDFVSITTSADVHIANNQFIIIEGEAGCGKSHLLGFYSNETRKRHIPALLFLGHSFSALKSIESTIFDQLHGEGTCEELFEGLNRIGQRLGQRIPIMIDALNESREMKHWRDSLPGFINYLNAYPYIALVVTVRHTYKEHVIKQEYLKQWKDYICVHDGLLGHEYEAVKAFCDYYDLNFIHMPIMEPEFGNPLYLHMACKIAKESNKESLPTGGNINDLFEEYAHSLDKKFGIARPEIYDHRDVVSKAIKIISREIYATKNEYIPLKRCDDLLLAKYSYAPSLLSDLLGESLLSKEIDLEGNEYVRFTYQRMNDYYIARILLEGCKTREDVEQRLKEQEEIIKSEYMFQGLLEQLAILIPVQYDVELFEVMNMDDVTDSVGFLFHSMHWRPANTVHAEAILQYLNRNKVSRNRRWSALLYLSAIPGNPFNGDYWHRIMKSYPTMAERDGDLQNYILETIRWDSEANNIRRLINGAWIPSDNIEDEIARLVGETLAWLLSSTIHEVRDQTTKAMVNLLQYKPQVLLWILREFRDVNDIYIQERLLGVAYGCVLRCKDKSAVCTIADYVFQTIFAGGNPPAHMLIRDYACNIVDYAHRVCGLSGVDMQLVLPPYHTQLPELPKREEVDAYKVDYQEEYAVEQNAILHSVYDGISDFGNKIVSPSIDDFATWSFIEEEEYQQLLSKKSKKDKTQITSYEFALRAKENPSSLRIYDSEEENRKIAEKMVKAAETELGKKLTLSEIERLRDVLIPNHIKKQSTRFNRRNTYPYLYWIVKRVFELGYDRGKHGEYDREVTSIEDDFNRERFVEGRMERIGKKYEWIAYRELMGYLSDHYYIEDPWNTSHLIPYDGAWQNFWRDCDPVCITRRDEEKRVKTWTDYALRGNWELAKDQWLKEAWSLDEVKEMIVRKEESGARWFTIHDDQHIRARKRLGENQYNYKQFYTYQIKAYLIKKKDKDKAIAMSGKVNFLHHETSSPVDSTIRYFMREKYWSRACKIDEEMTSQIWNEIYSGGRIKVAVPYVGMTGNMEDDYSGTRATYLMPIQMLFDGMMLSYGKVDGDLEKEGEICATCNPNRTHHFLMKEKPTKQYLDDNGLDIVWMVNHELYYSDDKITFSNASLWEHSGLFYFDESGELQGTFIVQDRNGR